MGPQLISLGKVRNLRGKTSLRTRELSNSTKIRNPPTLNQAQSADGFLHRTSQICHRLRPFVAGLYAFFEYGKLPSETGIKSPTTYFGFGGSFSRRPRFLAPRSFPRILLNNEIYTDSRARSPLEYIILYLSFWIFLSR